MYAKPTITSGGLLAATGFDLGPGILIVAGIALLVGAFLIVRSRMLQSRAAE